MISESPIVRISSDEPRRLILRGELDFRMSSLIRRRAEELLASGSVPLRVDVKDLRFMDSSGLSALLHAAQQAKTRRNYVCVIGASERIERLLHATGLGSELHFEDPLAEDPCGDSDSDEPLTEMEMALPCDPSALALARERVASFFKNRTTDPYVQEDVYLALGEAVANAIRHACPNSPPGSGIRLRAACDDERITLEIADPGPGFDPETVPDPVAENLIEGGMGLFFMRKVMDSVEYLRGERGGAIRMTKRFKEG